MDDVNTLDKIRYNTNNNYAEGCQPCDYSDVLSSTKTSTWINLFKNYESIYIDLKSVRASWLKDANKIGIHTGVFPHAFDEERDQLAQSLSQEYKNIFNGTQYFVRTETVSLKCGQHKAGPYVSMRKVLESLVTCMSGHSPLSDTLGGLTLYFIPWEKLSLHREYRGFVYENKLTALSQQHLYCLCDRTGAERDPQIIVDYYYSVMRQRISHVYCYTFDIAVLEDNTPYFIELNSFGSEYAAGSALFGWEQDRDVLYNNSNDRMVFRYTVE